MKLTDKERFFTKKALQHTGVLEKHAPCKKRYLRANHKPFIKI